MVISFKPVQPTQLLTYTRLMLGEGSPMKSLARNPLLEQFLSESRELLEGIGQKLMQLEDSPNDRPRDRRSVQVCTYPEGQQRPIHIPEMTRVLHAGEDLLGKVRGNEMTFSRELADRLLDAMDFVGLLSNEIESTGCIDASRAADSARLAESLRALMADFPDSLNPALPSQLQSPRNQSQAHSVNCHRSVRSLKRCALKPSAVAAMERSSIGFLSACARVFLSRRRSIPSARQTPGLLWGRVLPSEPLPPLAGLDTYRCSLKFHLLTAAFHEELVEYFRYVPDQVALVAIDPLWLSISECEPQKTVGIEDECISGSPDSEQREVRNPSKKQPRSLGF